MRSAPRLSEFLCLSSSGSSLSLLPAEPAAQVGALDDCTPLEKCPGTSMAPKMIINFALQGALGCERRCTLHQASLNFCVHRLPALTLVLQCQICHVYGRCSRPVLEPWLDTWFSKGRLTCQSSLFLALASYRAACDCARWSPGLSEFLCSSSACSELGLAAPAL